MQHYALQVKEEGNFRVVSKNIHYSVGIDELKRTIEENRQKVVNIYVSCSATTVS